MSKIHKINVNCPKCGEELEIEIFDSINVTVCPELLEKVEDFSVFHKMCPKCNTYLPLEYNCMFHDMDKKYIIWSTSNIEDKDALFNECKLWIAEGYKLRFVDTNKDIVEKVSMFKNDLYDTIIEFIKLQVTSQLDNDNVEETINNIRFIGIKDDMLNFSKFIGENKIQNISVPMDQYNKYHEIIPENIYEPESILSTFVSPFNVADYLFKNDYFKK